MFLYLISSDEQTDYDTYDSAIVVANDENEARTMHPDGRSRWIDGKWMNNGLSFEFHSSWLKYEDVKVVLIGVADPKYTEPEVILASYNAD